MLTVPFLKNTALIDPKTPVSSALQYPSEPCLIHGNGRIMPRLTRLFLGIHQHVMSPGLSSFSSTAADHGIGPQVEA